MGYWAHFSGKPLPTILITVVHSNDSIQCNSDALCVITCHKHSQLALKIITKGCVNLLINTGRVYHQSRLVAGVKLLERNKHPGHNLRQYSSYLPGYL